MNCNFCQTLLTFQENLYHNILCPVQQYYKQLAELDFLLNNAKLSTMQCKILRDNLKKNYYKLYSQNIIDQCNIFSDYLPLPQDPLLVSFSEYRCEEIHQTPNYIGQSQFIDTPAYEEQQSQIIQYQNNSDTILENIIVKREEFTLNQCLENLILMDEIEIEIPDVEILNKKISKQYNCIVCNACFKNKRGTIHHMKRTHFKYCNKKYKH